MILMTSFLLFLNLEYQFPVNIRVVNSLSKDNNNNNNGNDDRGITFNARFPKGSPYTLISLPSFTVSPKENSKTITFFVSGPYQQQQQKQPLNMILSANIAGTGASSSSDRTSGDESLLINGMNGFTIVQQPSKESLIDAVVTKSGNILGFSCLLFINLLIILHDVSLFFIKFLQLHVKFHITHKNLF